MKMILLGLQRNLWMNLQRVRRFTTSPVILSEKDNCDDDKEVKSQEEATDKLNKLLNMMIQEDDGKPKTSIKLVQAVKRKKEKREKEKPLGKQLDEAAKDVATSLGGDVEKTESELLKILLRRSEPNTNILTDVLADIKVDKSESVSRAQQVKASLQRSSSEQKMMYDNMKKDLRRPRKRTEPSAYVNILGAEPSSYFKGLRPQPPPCTLQTWSSCVERDMRLAVTHPPTNIYEQMIQWTNNGMLWHFPIDNFQGLEEEKKVSFEDHVFLEQHLDGWCPEKGPIRHFMELVCVGLAKNYWLTVEEKKRHIMWYRDYFADKKTLIKELGAGNIAVEGDQKKDLFESVIHRPLT